MASASDGPLCAGARRLALVKAIESLPTEPGDWSPPDAALQAACLEEDLQRAQKMICSFAQWARDHIHELPRAAEEELEATDFNDYYKIVMSRVQFIFAQATAGADFSSSELTHPLCCFQSQLRRMPTFKKKGVEVKLGLLQGTRQTGTEGCFPSVEEEFRAKLAAVGRRRFTEATLTALLSSHSPRCNKMEEALCPVNASWIKALLGQPLFHLLAEGEPFSESERVEVKVERQPAGQVVLLAQGPWFRVTFVETPLLQFLASFMTDYMLVHGDDDLQAWDREALIMFALTAQKVADDVLTSGKGDVMFMSGRRAPNLEFHLLQHMYLSHIWPDLNTSSLFAARIFQQVGRPLKVAGTWAHEGPMAFMAMYGSRLDSHVPVSTILWTVFFWACTCNHTVLPDAVGSATYKCMLRDLGLLGDVSIARQDSGQLERFAAIFKGICPVMASEIETYADIDQALALGYTAFGAGGFFGEKRKSLGVEFSLAAKLTKATMVNGDGTTRVGYAGKLGDFSGGSWARFDSSSAKAAKQKFIVNAEVDCDAIFEQLVEFAMKGDAIHDGEATGGAAQAVMGKDDATALVFELDQLLGAPSMVRYPGLAERLDKHMTTIATAAEQLV